MPVLKVPLVPLGFPLADGRLSAWPIYCPCESDGYRPGVEREPGTPDGRGNGVMARRMTTGASEVERPRILVTTSTEFRDEDVRRRDSTTGSNYSEGVIRAGGLRFMVANLDPGLVDTYLDNVDGVLFTGGVDLDPDSYGQQPARGLGKVDPQRDA